MNAFLRCRRKNGLLLFLLLPRCLPRQQITRSIRGSRHYSSQGAVGLQTSSPSIPPSHPTTGRVPQVPYGFRELGIRDSIAKAIGKAFPDVQRPTIAQADFIPAILNGKDVLLHDETGTGKSFGSIIALLNKPRAKPLRHGQPQEGPCITSLVIVPHRDLAFQMMHWIESILNHSGPNRPSLDLIAQLIVRGESISMEEQIKKLRTSPPHILIGTPRALWDIHGLDRQALQLENIATVVVDEVDYLLDIPPPYVRKSRERAVWKNFKKHPSLARQLLETILPVRKPGAVPLAGINYDDDGDSDSGKTRHKGITTSAQPLQIVMSSATVNSNLTNFLCDGRWLDEDRVVLSGKQLLKANVHMLTGENARGPGVVHHAFVVSPDGRVRNIEFAVRPGEEAEIGDEDEENEAPQNFRERLENMRAVSPQSPTSPLVMEAIASVFVTDVPHLALLVLPPGTSVQKSILELQDLGVTARALDLRSRDFERLRQSEDGGEEVPILLVATPATIRGVDLPQLTHVFLAGAADTSSTDMFKHVSGRVGRFGRDGKVMTFVTEREVERREGLMRTTKNPGGLLKAFYRKLQIKPVWFDLSAAGFDN